MKKLALAAILVATQVFAVSAFAEDKTRVSVKADAASANKAGAIAKGEGPALPRPRQSRPGSRRSEGRRFRGQQGWRRPQG